MKRLDDELGGVGGRIEADEADLLEQGEVAITDEMLEDEDAAAAERAADLEGSP